MNIQQATEAAERISKAFGTAVLFREAGRRESYQAVAGDLPDGGAPIANFNHGIGEPFAIPSSPLGNPMFRRLLAVSAKEQARVIRKLRKQERS